MGRKKRRYPFYAVAVGNWTCVVETWEECKALTNEVPNSRNKGCFTRQEAEGMFSGGPTTAWVQTDEDACRSSIAPSSSQTLPNSHPLSTPGFSASDPDAGFEELPRLPKRVCQSLDQSQSVSQTSDSSNDVLNDPFVYNQDCEAVEKVLELFDRYEAVRITPVGQAKPASIK
ncbi:hypothetical protein FSARC_11968 [Fusarium sarcochroum]|uniref:Ribonuclease H1 N-terminal domain-containing protein n=1 Tax=Fusarium sarcochroum TaxID=1208366 RepID=A0A8H4TBS0_9HYPO|nr:hypothetical protein FSARC_11968 [Fusarium sarcochroum]